MRSCVYCSSTYFTAGGAWSGNRAVETPDGRIVHFRCLREWLIDDAMTRFFGRQSSKGRTALRKRLRLDYLQAKDLPTLRNVATELRYSLPWVSSVQVQAMHRFEKEVARARAEKEAGAKARGRKREQHATTKQLVEALRQDVENLSQHLEGDIGPLDLPDLDL